MKRIQNVLRAEAVQTTRGYEIQTDIEGKWSVHIDVKEGSDMVYVFISGGPDDIAVGEEMHVLEVEEYVQGVIGQWERE